MQLRRRIKIKLSTISKSHSQITLTVYNFYLYLYFLILMSLSRRKEFVCLSCSFCCVERNKPNSRITITGICFALFYLTSNNELPLWRVCFIPSHSVWYKKEHKDFAHKITYLSILWTWLGIVNATLMLRSSANFFNVLLLHLHSSVINCRLIFSL